MFLSFLGVCFYFFSPGHFHVFCSVLVMNVRGCSLLHGGFLLFVFLDLKINSRHSRTCTLFFSVRSSFLVAWQWATALHCWRAGTWRLCKLFPPAEGVTFISEKRGEKEWKLDVPCPPPELISLLQILFLVSRVFTTRWHRFAPDFYPPVATIYDFFVSYSWFFLQFCCCLFHQRSCIHGVSAESSSHIRQERDPKLTICVSPYFTFSHTMMKYTHQFMFSSIRLINLIYIFFLEIYFWSSNDFKITDYSHLNWV